MPVGSVTVGSFKERYLALKAKHYNDREIAMILDIACSTLCLYKKRYGVPLIRTPKRNRVGVSEKEFEIAKANGISRKRVLQRVRQYGWSLEMAILTPVVNKKKGMK